MEDKNRIYLNRDTLLKVNVRCKFKEILLSLRCILALVLISLFGYIYVRYMLNIAEVSFGCTKEFQNIIIVCALLMYIPTLILMILHIVDTIKSIIELIKLLLLR